MPKMTRKTAKWPEKMTFQIAMHPGVLYVSCFTVVLPYGKRSNSASEARKCSPRDQEKLKKLPGNN